MSMRNAVDVLIQDRAPEANHIVRIALAECARAAFDISPNPGTRHRQIFAFVPELARRLGLDPAPFVDLPNKRLPNRQAWFHEAYRLALGGPCEISKVTTTPFYDPVTNISKVVVSGHVTRPVKYFVELFDPRNWAADAPQSWTASYPVDNLADQKVDRDLDPPAMPAGPDLVDAAFFEVAWWTLGSAVLSTHRNIIRVDYRVDDRANPSKIAFDFRQHGCLDSTYFGIPDEGGIDIDSGIARCDSDGAGGSQVTLSKTLRFTKPDALRAEVNQVTSVVLAMWMELLLTQSLCEPPVAKAPAPHLPCGCLGICGCFQPPDMAAVRSDAVQRIRDVARCGEKIVSSYQDLWRSQAAIWCGLLPDPCGPAPKPGTFLLDSVAAQVSAWGKAYDSYHQFAAACLGLPTKTKVSTPSPSGPVQLIHFVKDVPAECIDPQRLPGVSSAFLGELEALDPPTVGGLKLAEHVRFTVAGASDDVLVSLVNLKPLEGVLVPGPTYKVEVRLGGQAVATLELYVRP